MAQSSSEAVNREARQKKKNCCTKVRETYLYIIPGSNFRLNLSLSYKTAADAKACRVLLLI